MEYSTLKTLNGDVKVSKLCLGTLTIGPLQANMSVDKGAEVILAALDNGVNFLDSAEYYRTYPYIKKALEIYIGNGGKREDIVVSTKSYAYSETGAKDSVERALNEIGTDYIDIFMMHEQESIYTMRGHEDALLYYDKLKSGGIIKAVGISTHHTDGVAGAVLYNENAGRKIIDVVHPIYNIAGLGIISSGGGNSDSEDKAHNLETMRIEIEKAKRSGIFIFAMKALGGGNLFRNAGGSLEFVLSDSNIDAVAVGMKSVGEVGHNIYFFNHGKFKKDYHLLFTDENRKRLHVEDWCECCGECLTACSHNAITLCGGKASCDQDKCVLCGYCAGKCKIFAIKVI